MRNLITRAVLAVLSMATLTHAADTPMRTAAAASNAFAIDLYAQVRQSPGNICLSPYSISSALNMTAAGAAGKTAEQMLSVLHWTGQPGDLPAASSDLTNNLLGLTASAPAEPTDPQIGIANALFGQRGYPYRKEFLDLVSSKYNAPLQDVDFVTQPQQAADQINKWAADKTHDKIQNAIPQSAINPATRLVLINAIYFKAPWLNEFKKESTSDQPFFTDAKNQATVPLMTETKSLDYAETDSLQALKLPYHGDYSMVILLPKKRDGLEDLEKSLTALIVNRWLDKLSPQEVKVYLPKFKLQGEYQLKDPLQKLGMTDAFSTTADFSGMISADKLCIDQVIHKTFISADEAGTEAAATTGVSMRIMAMRPRPQADPVLFRADHPFLFILRQTTTGTILFMGRVTNPK